MHRPRLPFSQRLPGSSQNFRSLVPLALIAARDRSPSLLLGSADALWVESGRPNALCAFVGPVQGDGAKLNDTLPAGCLSVFFGRRAILDTG